jgi:hypothetical protein
MGSKLFFSRWLRCIVSREFEIEHVIKFWDFIFSGIESSHLRKHSGKEFYDCENFFENTDDPLINLDCLCVAMICHQRTQRKYL